MKLLQMSEQRKRLYQPIWEKLKTDGKCFVPCTFRQRQTVIKAVQKEKYMDTDKDAWGKMEVRKMKHGVEFKILIPIKAEYF